MTAPWAARAGPCGGFAPPHLSKVFVTRRKKGRYSCFMKRGPRARRGSPSPDKRPAHRCCPGRCLWCRSCGAGSGCNLRSRRSGRGHGHVPANRGGHRGGAGRSRAVRVTPMRWATSWHSQRVAGLSARSGPTSTAVRRTERASERLGWHVLSRHGTRQGRLTWQPDRGRRLASPPGC